MDEERGSYSDDIQCIDSFYAGVYTRLLNFIMMLQHLLIDLMAPGNHDKYGLGRCSSVIVLGRLVLSIKTV